MADESFVKALLAGYAPQIPLYLVWFIAMILAFVYLGRHPAVSLLVLAAMSLLIVQSVVGTFLAYWIQFQMEPREWTVAKMASYLAVVALVRTAVSTGAWILLVVAIFGWRRQALHVPADESFHDRGDYPERGSRE